MVCALALAASTVIASSAAQAAPAGPATAPVVATASGFSYTAFHTPSGNIRCAAFRSDGQWFLRCDIYRHDWRVAPRTCDAGDYGSSVSLTGNGRRPKFICVSDAVDSGRKVRYGRTIYSGPFACTSRRSGLTCTNRRGAGWFLSREAFRFYRAR